MNIPPEWKKVFEQAGVTEEQLKDQSTAQFIFDFMTAQQGQGQQGDQPQPPPAQSATMPRRSLEQLDRKQSAMMTPMVPEPVSPSRPMSTATAAGGGRR